MIYEVVLGILIHLEIDVLSFKKKNVKDLEYLDRTCKCQCSPDSMVLNTIINYNKLATACVDCP